jgi:isoleucyl-tRNA synthetase
MVGWEYRAHSTNCPPWASLCRGRLRHRVIAWKEVGADEGTGIVHIAPGCGAEDFQLSKDHDLPIWPRWTRSGIM